MASVSREDTGPERLLRSALHREGLRFRLHDRDMPGTPDIVLKRHGAAIFVHGCYWHNHGCKRSTMPKSRKAFWRAKFLANAERDARKRRELRKAGWRILTVWECALVGPTAKAPDVLARRVRSWLESGAGQGDVSGRRLPSRSISRRDVE